MELDAATERALWAPLEDVERTIGTLAASRRTYRPEAALEWARTRPALPTAVLGATQPAPAAQPPAAPQPVTAGAAHEVFQLVEPIGEGGMGQIWKAVQNSLRREVAVKRARDGLEHQVDDFLSEAIVTAQLEHANIVPVHLLGQTPEGTPLLAMKLVKGTSWSQLIHRPAEARRSGLREHLRVLLAASNAVAFAHRHGIIHRDLKPENVMVGELGQVFVVDWGIAAALDPEGGRDAEAMPAAAARSPAGTPGYMAPELARGDGAHQDRRTDVYLLGACLHEVLTGQPPHEGDSLHAVLRHAVESPAFDYDDSVPRELAEICHRAMARDPRDRFPEVGAFQRAIEQFQEHREAYRLIEKGTSLLDELRGRVDAYGDAPDEERGEIARAINEVHVEARLVFEHALTIWPDAPDARSGRRAGGALMLRHALQTNDTALAALMLPQCDDPELCERARAMQARAQAEAEELVALKGVVRRLDWSSVVPALSKSFVLAGVLGAFGAVVTGVVMRQGYPASGLLLGAIWAVIAAAIGLYAMPLLRAGRALDSLVSRRVIGMWAAAAVGSVAGGTINAISGRDLFSSVHSTMILVAVAFASMSFQTRRWLLVPAVAFLAGACAAGTIKAYTMEIFGATWLLVMSGVGLALRAGATLGDGKT